MAKSGPQMVSAKSSTARTCFRCLQIGLPAGGIAAGERHIAVIGLPRVRTKFACLDCFDRLCAEMREDGE